jgi:hypothetical protein
VYENTPYPEYAHIELFDDMKIGYISNHQTLKNIVRVLSIGNQRAEGDVLGGRLVAIGNTCLILSSYIQQSNLSLKKEKK